MLILLVTNKRIIKTMLPTNIYGNYWITDSFDDEEKKILNIEEENGKWKIKSNLDYQLFDNKTEYDDLYLENNLFYYIKSKINDQIYLLYTFPTFENNITYLDTTSITTITIGKSSDCNICYKNTYISNTHAKLIFDKDIWKIVDMHSNLGIFVNDERFREKQINYGDVIFIAGLRIILLKNKLIINNQPTFLSFNGINVINYERKDKLIYTKNDEAKKNVELYSEDDYFLRAPRFKTSIEKETMVIDPPPAKINQDEMPALLMYGSMFTMGFMSIMTLYSSFDGLLNGTRTKSSAIPSIISGMLMLGSMLLMPLLNRKYQKKQKIKKEKERQEKYRKYIDEKASEIDMIMKSQKRILKENYLSLGECEEIILNKSRQLWERKVEQPDFLNIRLGLGNMPVELDIKYPEEHFSMEEDDLKDILQVLVKKSKELENVPIVLSLIQKYILAIVGKKNEIFSYMKTIILQLVTFQSYEDLKLVFFIDKANQEKWDYAKILPHTWSNDKKIRYFATTYEEMQQLSAILEEDLQSRKEDKSISLPYYIIITDDYGVARNVEIIIDLLKQKNNIGFGMIVLNENLSTLPNECTSFINVSNMKGGFFQSELISTKQNEFTADFYDDKNFYKCCLSLINTPIKFTNQLYTLPNNYNFLEMYNVGRVEQLNSLERWEKNDTTLSLQVPVGIDTHGMLFNLDIHEKAFGPHGLVAGMTGSGKSEFLITYILSLAVNFHPEDVSFILIDYKGGGLAGAFENEMTGIKLPHLAGKITNLDTAEMQRALVSIQSELRRRQTIFNETRKKINEGVIDIYKYQKLYHSGIVNEPISHLLIISDEFAELKMQQPEFMDQLISTARIGRSLGVHLILATQKPSGIVNDQIRSNSRFKICLKVQEATDSKDVINTNDAASLTQVGRFYLQVGYNEYYALGQSAWSGAPYIPSDKFQKKVDESLTFINNIGLSIKELEPQTDKNLLIKGEQITNIVKYLSELAKLKNIKIRQLWLNKIPAIINIEMLKEKYNYQKVKNIVTGIVGEYDDPFNQKKNLLTLNLTNDGNVIIYGSAGSGKEMLLTTLIYSLVSNYTPSEVNIYAIDLGTNSLKMFTDYPQVGDIVLQDESEKVNNLFKYLFDQIEERRKNIQNYGGDFENYLNNSGKKLPLISVIINNLEAFYELYSNYEDSIIQIAREGIKYGINLMLTTSSINVRYKLLQNFSQKLVLKMNDNSDYNSIIGNTNKLYPSDYKGRGLIKIDSIYEFQTASITDDQNLLNFIKENKNLIISKYEEFAPRIPMLPKIVSYEIVEKSISDLNSIPIGISKDNLNIVNFDFKKDLISTIFSQDVMNYKNNIYSIVKELFNIENVNTITIDALNLFENSIGNYYYNSNFKELYFQLLDLMERYTSNLNSNIIIIIGFEEFIEKCNFEGNNISELFEKAKKIDKFNFVLIENDNIIKKYIYEEWYRNNVNNTRGIWLGSGITEQYSIKLSKVDKKLYEKISNNFGYIITNGNAELIKLVDFVGGEEDE